MGVCHYATNTSIPVQKVNTPARSHKNDNISASAKKFLESLAKLSSHYCRANTDKQYLEPAFETYVDLYREYELFCEKNNLPVASLTTLKSIFKTMRMSFFSPKKDQCDLCVSYKAGNVSELGYTQHLQRKHAARDEKKHDIELCLQDNSMVIVLFVDLQKVLLAPAFNASVFYYKTKLCSYNYTIYDKKTHDALCYLWNGTASDLTAKTFACLLIDYLISNERCQAADTIIIYSDGCTYQNRCVQLSNALLFFAMKYNKQVIEKYVVRDHTQMEVDSVHALIERSVRRKDIYTPACYRLSGDPKVVNISQLKYDNEGLFYRLEHTDKDWKLMPQRRKDVDINVNLKRQYEAQLQITTSKWNDLQSLKSVIPSDFHAFYDNLPKK